MPLTDKAATVPADDDYTETSPLPLSISSGAHNLQKLSILYYA